MIDRIKKTKVESIGHNVWKDARNNVYILNKDKTKFLKMSPSQSSMYRFLNMRLILAFIVLFIFEYYFNQFALALACSIGIYIVMEIIYRFVFLQKLTEAGKVEGEIDKSRLSRVFHASKKELYKGLGLSVLITGLLIYNFISLEYKIEYAWNFSEPQQMLTVLLYLVITIVLILSVLLHLFALLKQNNK